MVKNMYLKAKGKKNKSKKRKENKTIPLSQEIARNAIDKLTANIKEPCCRICGDTEKDGKLVEIQGEFCLCEFCFNVQINM
tara:strand:- start:1384 stop:1626 length:243 start_codon:yes stop_codon:yes gene_type:complete